MLNQNIDVTSVDQVYGWCGPINIDEPEICGPLYDPNP